MDFSNKTIVVGVSGGIAAYKICHVVSALNKAGADVHVIMTKNATEFVTPLTFETLSNNRVVTDTFDRNFEYNVKHVSLAKAADIFLVAPATANVIAKMANGIADDFLSTTVLAMTCPVLVAPAMNTAMLNNAATRQNMDTLKKRGIEFIQSAEGMLACGDMGDGRLAEPDIIIKALYNALFPVRDYENKTVLITAGATRQPLDPVRYITNSSSGKMGYELACAAQRRGAKIIFILGASNATKPKPDWNVINVQTTQDMYDAVIGNMSAADCIILAGAPCDYVADYENQKIKAQTLELKLSKTPDIAKQAGKIKDKRKLVIFAAETENLIANALQKLMSKNADMAVANDVTRAGAGFNTETNIATIITRNNQIDLPLMPKSELSDRILDELNKLK